MVLLRYMHYCVKKSPHFLIQSEVNKNHSWLTGTRFPAPCVSFNVSFKNLLRVLIGWFDHCTEWYLCLASISRYPNENCFKICTNLIRVFNLNCKRFKSRKQVPSKKGTSQAWIKDRHKGGETWELVFPFFHFLPDLYVFARLSSPCTVAQNGQTQISLPKHKTVSQNSNQIPKTQISLPKHKPIFQNTNQFTKTQISFTKHKPISRNINQKTGHLLCHYQRAWMGLIPRIFRVQHGDF